MFAIIFNILETRKTIHISSTAQMYIFITIFKIAQSKFYLVKYTYVYHMIKKKSMQHGQENYNFIMKLKHLNMQTDKL